jgi:hypothetical protein
MATKVALEDKVFLISSFFDSGMSGLGKCFHTISCRNIAKGELLISSNSRELMK